MAIDKEQGVFDSYETTGIVVPGAALLFGLWLIFPNSLPSGIELKDISLGAFGIFAVAAFCVGHLLQSPANLIESALWSLCGRPTERMVGNPRALAASQRALLRERVRQLLGLDAPEVEAGAAEWHPIVRAIAAAITAAGRSARMDKFNATYGLHRGLATSLLIVAVVALVAGKLSFAIAFAIACAFAAMRAIRFAKHYATELWTQFFLLAVPPS